MWVIVWLLTLACLRTQGQKEITTKELEFFGNSLAFDAWAWRHTRLNSEINTAFSPFDDTMSSWKLENSRPDRDSTPHSNIGNLRLAG